MAAGETQPQESELEKMLKEYQVLQEQLRSIAMQLEQLQGQKMDMDRAKEELDKAEGKIYISVGGVIVETAKEKAIADIKDRSELNDVRLQNANRSYTDLRNKEKTLNDKITEMYRKAQGLS